MNVDDATGRHTGFFGLLFAGSFAVWLVAIVDGPMFTASAAEVGEYLEGGGAVIRVAGLVLSMGVVLFLFPFAAGIRRLIETDPDNEWLGSWLMAALVFASTMLVLDVGLGTSVSLISDPPPELVESTWSLSKTINASFSHLATGVWVAVASVGLLRTKAIPAWIGWLGIGLLGPQMITGSWLLTGEFSSLHDAAGGIGHLGSFLVWVPAVSIARLLRTNRTSSDPVTVRVDEVNVPSL